MADDLLLSSALVLPEALRVTGFEWRHPTVEDALEEMINGREPSRLTERAADRHSSAGRGTETRKGSLAGSR
jgi:hypothetical protein